MMKEHPFLIWNPDRNKASLLAERLSNRVGDEGLSSQFRLIVLALMIDPWDKRRGISHNNQKYPYGTSLDYPR